MPYNLMNHRQINLQYLSKSILNGVMEKRIDQLIETSKSVAWIWTNCLVWLIFILFYLHVVIDVKVLKALLACNQLHAHTYTVALIVFVFLFVHMNKVLIV